MTKEDQSCIRKAKAFSKKHPSKTVYVFRYVDSPDNSWLCYTIAEEELQNANGGIVLKFINGEQVA